MFGKLTLLACIWKGTFSMSGFLSTSTAEGGGATPAGRVLLNETLLPSDSAELLWPTIFSDNPGFDSYEADVVYSVSGTGSMDLRYFDNGSLLAGNVYYSTYHYKNTTTSVHSFVNGSSLFYPNASHVAGGCYTGQFTFWLGDVTEDSNRLDADRWVYWGRASNTASSNIMDSSGSLGPTSANNISGIQLNGSGGFKAGSRFKFYGVRDQTE